MSTSAKNIHLDDKFKLGAVIKPDERTLSLLDFVDTSAVSAPKTWDFDKGRSPFPHNVWGNDAYGDCELAARANCLLRLQRKQTKSTPALSDQDVIDLYKQMTGCVSPGDQNDTGLSTVGNLNQWRSGWNITKSWSVGSAPTARDYHISAYGYINPKNSDLFRLATYLFSGTILGIDLPLTAYYQIQNGQPWDVDPNGGANAEPGSWGGHAVYVKRYDPDNVYMLTWGREQPCTEAFINTYVMEAYSVVDSLDTWSKYHLINVQKLIDQMRSIGVNVNQ